MTENDYFEQKLLLWPQVPFNIYLNLEISLNKSLSCTGLIDCSDE